MCTACFFYSCMVGVCHACRRSLLLFCFHRYPPSPMRHYLYRVCIFAAWILILVSWVLLHLVGACFSAVDFFLCKMSLASSLIDLFTLFMAE